MDLLNRPSLYDKDPPVRPADAFRVASARCGLLAASEARGLQYPIADEAVTALLTDLRHFCAARRIDFDLCMRFSDSYYNTFLKAPSNGAGHG